MLELLANYLSTYQLHVFAAILLIVGFSVSNQTYKNLFYFLGLIVFSYLYFSWRFLELILWRFQVFSFRSALPRNVEKKV